MLFKFKFIINSYSQQFYFSRTENNLPLTLSLKGAIFLTPRTINWNLPILDFIELILNQSNTFLRSYLRSENTCSRFLLQMYSVLSLLKMLKYFEVMLEIFEFSHMKEIVESWLLYANKFSWIIQSCFPNEIIKQS